MEVHPLRRPQYLALWRYMLAILSLLQEWYCGMTERPFEPISVKKKHAVFSEDMEWNYTLSCWIRGIIARISLLSVCLNKPWNRVVIHCQQQKITTGNLVNKLTNCVNIIRKVNVSELDRGIKFLSAFTFTSYCVEVHKLYSHLTYWYVLVAKNTDESDKVRQNDAIDIRNILVTSHAIPVYEPTHV